MSPIAHMPEPQNTLLGRGTVYGEHLDPELLQAIPRSLGRSVVGRSGFRGCDLWGLYELTWLTPSGLPKVAVGRLLVPASSPSIVESKSLKLYLGSFTQTVFESVEAVSLRIEEDVGQTVGSPVRLELWDADTEAHLAPLPGTLLEGLPGLPPITHYEPSAELLEENPSGASGEVCWRTSLFRSLCPVTGQPDHAAVSIRLRGRGPTPQSLLAYLVSFRHHRGFHEQCVEQIFADIDARFSPEVLDVQAAFTRRGGIDISPFRSKTCDEPENFVRIPRQ